MQIAQAKSQKVSENPFYGKRELFGLHKYFQKTTDENTNASTINSMLDRAWGECSTQADKELFFIIIFAAGDITNRDHNMFGKLKVDQGGQAKRKAFRLALDWILKRQEPYFYRFMPLIAEYTNYENLFYNRITTDRKKGTVLSQEKLPIDTPKVVEYLREKISSEATSSLELGLIAKFLPKVPKTKRWRKDKEGKSVARNKQQATLVRDAQSLELIATLSAAMGWEVVEYPKMKRFKGYEQFRSAHLANTEAHLFSTKKICNFDKTQFFTWLSGLPSGARNRVQRRLVAKEGTTLKTKAKWFNTNQEDLGVLYQDWLLDKEIAMKKLVAMSDEEKGAMDKKELAALTKHAKVNTGGTTIFDTFSELYKASRGQVAGYTPTSETSLLLQTLIDKVKLDVPVMTCVDISSSMSSTVSASGVSMSRLDVAKLVAAIMLYKNPSPELADTMITFNDTSQIYSSGTNAVIGVGRNRFVSAGTTTTKVPVLSDKKKPFFETLRNVSQLVQPSGCTDFSGTADNLKKWVEEDPTDSQRRIELIQSYPVWLVISDGDLNSHMGPNGSMQAFKHKMLTYFGASPVVVVWDILSDYSVKNDRYFENIGDLVHLAGVNPGVINQLFYNIDDLDIIDIYTELKALHASSRYLPVKAIMQA